MKDRAHINRGLLINAPLHFNIIAIFVALFLLLSGGLIVYNYNRNAELALEAADSLLQNVSDKVLERTRNFIDPPANLVNLMASLPELATLPDMYDHPVAILFLEALQKYPQLYGLFVGYDNGDFFQVVHFAGVDEKTLARLGAPRGVAYGVRFIEQRPEARIQTWMFLDKSRQPIGEPVVSTASYDPRGRPWYKSAVELDRVSLTDAYIFSSLKAPGITVSRRVAAKGRVAVVASDITLARLSSFLREQKVGESGVVFIFDQNAELIAFPDSDKTVKRIVVDGKESLKPVKVTELEQEPLNEALRRFANQTNARFTFDIGGDEFIASVAALQGNFGADKRVAIVVPVDDFIGPIAEHRTRSLFFSIIPLLLSIPLIMWVSQWIARPIRAIVEETHKIRDLTFEESPEIDSRIIEIRDLAESVSAMKAAIRNFAQYVPKALVEQLIHSGNASELGGDRRQLSIMFSDVANFTDMAERMSPEELMLKTSHYFQELGEIILANQGSIDKFIGDAIMAFWNAPIDDKDHVADACRTMLLCRQRSVELNEQWAAQGEPVMHTRFGLHTGDTVVGNIGSPDRMDYTALGASVNLAARLEGLNKQYGTQLLVSESVYKKVQSSFLFRPVDVATVKGISQPINVYELCAALEGPDTIRASEEQLSLCRRWENIYTLHAAKNWSHANAALQDFIADFPDDPVAKVYAERYRTLLAGQADDADDEAVRTASND